MATLVIETTDVDAIADVDPKAMSLAGFSTTYAFIRNLVTSSVLSCLVPGLGGANETALQHRR
jgi:uncharacterized membrane protein